MLLFHKNKIPSIVKYKWTQSHSSVGTIFPRIQDKYKLSIRLRSEPRRSYRCTYLLHCKPPIPLKGCLLDVRVSHVFRECPHNCVNLYLTSSTPIQQINSIQYLPGIEPLPTKTIPLIRSDFRATEISKYY